LAAWLVLNAVLPRPSVDGLVDARHEKRRHDYSVVLNVRDVGLYGHALLTWFVHRSDGDRSVISFGYYADRAGGIIEVFDTTGAVKDELAAMQRPGVKTRLALVFWVDQAMYDATFERIKEWRGNGRYKVFRRDCVTFVADMLEPLRLKVPNRFLFPSPRQFVVALLEANAQREPQ
jgi:hypothetical protein